MIIAVGYRVKSQVATRFRQWATGRLHEYIQKGFAAHSWYLRNALVRANYNDSAKNITATNEYLNRFFDNVLFGKNHLLRNRELHINWVSSDTVSALHDTVNDAVNDTVLTLIATNPHITAEQLRVKLGVSITTAKRRIKALKDAGRIERIGSDKTGHWVVKNH